MNKNEQEFDALDLEEILKEFGSGAPDTLTDSEAEISHGIDDLDTLLGDTADNSDEPAPEPEQPPELFTMEELETATAPEQVTLFDVPSDATAEEADPAESTLTRDTIRLDDLAKAVAQAEKEREIAAEPQATAETIRMDSDEIQQAAEDAQAAADSDESDTPTPPTESASPEPIPFRPRQRLRELKRDLIAGPEKRYYDLTSIGVGKLQIAMLLTLLVILLSAGAGVLYAAGYVPENRMRLMVFGQILAMLLGALLGSQQMIEGVCDLFKGRFTLNTLLTITFFACCADSYFCLQEQRVPFCATFTLEVFMSLWSAYHSRTTETGMMDTLRKAVRLDAVVSCEEYYDGLPGYLRREGQVSDFMEHYQEVTGPEKVMSVYALVSLLLSIAIAAAATMLHGLSTGLQVLSTTLLVAVPASSFITLTRPMAVLERKLHALGTVLCGWTGIRGLTAKAAFPLSDEDIFPSGSAKLNGVKFYGERNTDQVIAYVAALMRVNGGTLAPVFEELLTTRAGIRYSATNVHYYGNGGIGGEINEEAVLMGTLDFLKEMGIAVPDGVQVHQAVYVAIGGELSGLFAVNYNRSKFSAQGITTLCSYRKIRTVLLAKDFMFTAGFMKERFGVSGRRLVFPTRDERNTLAAKVAPAEAPALALTTQLGLSPMAYAVTGARSVRKAWNFGLVIHLIGGILGMLIMAVLAYLGSVHLLTPIHILAYQLIWMIPGFLVTLWPRTT